jgi:small subunit ribosomal protein S16
MTRKGSRHNPFYRIVAAEDRSPRDGKYIELLGTYDPQQEPAAISLKMDRVQYWLSKGATASVTVSQMIKKNGAPAAQ